MGMSEFYRRVRERVGSDLLLIPAVAAIIRDGQGRILVQQRHDETWSLPAGAIEPGESPASAVVRESYEETGLRVRAARVAGVVGGASCRVRYANGHEVEYVVTIFDCDVAGGGLIDTNDETKRLVFVTKDELLPRLTFSYPPEVFDEARPAAFFTSESNRQD
jgi:8-oxo-dGTP pyrophosphatase MutT (NUDIX family)